jgi:hypothetical protein
VADGIGRETYRGWEDTFRLENGLIEARVVTAIGPRIIDLRLARGANVFHVRSEEAGGHDENEWMFRGGWRLWIAPERVETTYALDNSRCQAEVDTRGATLRVTGPRQGGPGIQKRIEVTIATDEPRLHVRSVVRNVGSERVTHAAWSLSAMRRGGRAFAPLDVGSRRAFDATRRLLFWSYATITDPRYRLGDRLIEVDHARVPSTDDAARSGAHPPESQPPLGNRPRRRDESKIGVDSRQGWAAYLLDDGTLYLKRFAHAAGGTYPDGGATIEIYSSAEFLELENLGAFTTLMPGDEMVLEEDWWLFSGVGLPANETADCEALMLDVLDGFVARTAARA